MQQDILESPLPLSSLPPARESTTGFFHSILRFAVYPFLLYTASVFLLTFPLMLDFNSAYLTTEGDGYQMIWDVWWVRYAIVHLHQSPFFTTMVHAPGGVSLWLHSLHVANGLISIPLRLVFSAIQTFNIIWLLAYAGSGLTAFWLCFAVTRRYWPSIAGGFVFAFCSYRWAHYYGHLNLISTECCHFFSWTASPVPTAESRGRAGDGGNARDHSAHRPISIHGLRPVGDRDPDLADLQWSISRTVATPDT